MAVPERWCGTRIVSGAHRFGMHDPSWGLKSAQRRVMTAIEQCRTAALGGRVEQCDHRGHRRIWYNSCRNCHCPTCQSLARAEWLERRRADLLPTEYFHVVFTVPPAFAEIAAQNKAVVHGLLFRTVADTLRTIAADPRHLGAEIGFFAVLHTWGQTLNAPAAVGPQVSPNYPNYSHRRSSILSQKKPFSKAKRHPRTKSGCSSRNAYTA